MPDRIWGFRSPEVRTVPVVLPGWEGIRVVQLTDLHFGLVTPRALLDDAVRRTNALEPDLVVLTGDFVCRGNRYIGQITETLQHLDARGVAVLGNHDHWVAADAVTRALNRADIDVLDNAWTSHTVRGQTVTIAGMDDGTTGHDDIDATLKGAPSTGVLGLTHNPRSAPVMWARGVRGVLSGHTHAGQFHGAGLVPRVYTTFLRQKHLAGLYEEDEGWVYVSAGLGAGAVPWRTGEASRREVTHLEFASPSG